MLYLPSEKMWPNRFVKVVLPTKAQIFARTGQVAVSPSGSYSGDDPARFGKTPTMSAEELMAAAEDFEPKKDE